MQILDVEITDFTHDGRGVARVDGKAVFEVATRTRQAGVPCFVVPGEDALDAFGKRLLNVEVEGPGRASGMPAERLEREAGRLGKRLRSYRDSASARTTAS